MAQQYKDPGLKTYHCRFIENNLQAADILGSEMLPVNKM